MTLSHPEWHLCVLSHSQPRGLCLLVQHSWAGTDVANLQTATPGQRATPSSATRGFLLLLLFRVETLGNGLSPRLYLPWNFHHLHLFIKIIFIFTISTIVIYAWIAFLRCCWVKGSVTGREAQH